MKNMFCVKCNKPREIGRRICDSCNKQRLLESAKNRPRYMFNNCCFICRNEFSAWQKKQRCCCDCRKLIVSLSQESLSNNNYIQSKGIAEHRYVAELHLGRPLAEFEIVHHIDDNPKHNARHNLAVMKNDTHGRLHHYLDHIKAFCHYHGNVEFFHENVRFLTEHWSNSAEEQITFL